MSIQARNTTAGKRYDVRLRDPAGHTYMRTFRTKKEAEEYTADERNEARSRSLDRPATRKDHPQGVVDPMAGGSPQSPLEDPGDLPDAS